MAMKSSRAPHLAVVVTISRGYAREGWGSCLTSWEDLALPCRLVILLGISFLNLFLFTYLYSHDLPINNPLDTFFKAN